MRICEKCNQAKDNEAFPFVEGSDTERTLWCQTCISSYRQKHFLGQRDTTLVGTTLDMPMTPQRKYYLEHREARLEYQRQRYHLLAGRPEAPLKRKYVRRMHSQSGEVSTIPQQAAALRERDKLERQLVHQMGYVVRALSEYVSFRKARSPHINDAAYAYKQTVREEEKIRGKLDMELRPLTGDPEQDIPYFQGTNNVETNGGNTTQTENLTEPLTDESSNTK